MQFKAERPSIYVKLNDGESIVGLLRGEPYEYEDHFKKGHCMRKYGDECQHCNKGEVKSFKFKANFITKENGALVCKILNNGWGVYKLLSQLNKEYSLDKTFIKITRHGTGQATNYTIIPAKDGAVTEEQERAISQIELHDLSDIKTPF